MKIVVWSLVAVFAIVALFFGVMKCIPEYKPTAKDLNTQLACNGRDVAKWKNAPVEITWQETREVLETKNCVNTDCWIVYLSGGMGSQMQFLTQTPELYPKGIKVQIGQARYRPHSTSILYNEQTLVRIVK